MMRSLWMALHRDRPSHQLPCVLTSLFRIHISNQILCQEEIDLFNGPALNAAAGPAQAFVDEQPPQGPVPNGRANENLRQLAILYLREPSSQDIVIHMEPGDANGIRVLITLNLANL